MLWIRRGVMLFLLFASLPALALERSESFYGRVRVDVIRGWGIAAAIDLEVQGIEPDGVFDHVVLLEAYGRIPAELPIEMDRAWVEVRENSARVQSAGGDLVVIFSLLRTSESLQARQEAERSAPRRRVLTYAGFGLSSTGGQWSEPLETSWIAVLGDPAAAERRTCTAGGPHATSCSVGCAAGCSVSCAAGTYACCGCTGLFNSVASCSCETTATGGGGGGTGGGTGGGEECSGTSWCPPSCMRCGGSTY